jgi:uncharacterized membrane protein YheB (UPF0754 family)
MEAKTIILFILLPLVSAGIGWLTNFVAIKMLLKPLRPKKFLGLTIQGLLPKRHFELADRISTAVARDFFTRENIAELIASTDLKPVLHAYIRRRWDERIGDILGLVPMVTMFLGQDKIDQIRDKIAEVFTDSSSTLTELLSGAVAEQADLAGIIRDNIIKFDLMKLEAIIEEIASNEFRTIERLGGVLGFIIGLAQAVLIFLLG